MPPKSKSKKVIAPMSIKVKCKAKEKKKKQYAKYSDMEGTTEDEEEPSVQDMMSSMRNMLKNLTNKMEGYEKWLDGRHDWASLTGIFLSPPWSLSRRTIGEQVPVRSLLGAARDTFTYPSSYDGI